MKVRIEPTSDLSLTPVSFSILTAYDTCEVWGTVRYGMRRTFENSGRALALEAGEAMHRVFAALRLYKLEMDGLGGHFEYHAHRIFGEQAASLLGRVRNSEDHFINTNSFALEALHSSGYYDDPFDKRRTLANLEECTLAYSRAMYSRQHPVWVQDVDNAESAVGIEYPFDYTLTFSDYGQLDTSLAVRYIGTIDAIHVKDGVAYIEENKTASRLDDSWASSFDLSHQVTGYTIFGSLLTGQHVNEAVIRGVRIPQPRRATEDSGIRNKPTTRNDDMRERFLEWIFAMYMKYLRTKDDPETAVRSTMSCNRYFRPCALVPYCDTSGPDERADILSSMVEADLSPSERTILDKVTE